MMGTDSRLAKAPEKVVVNVKGKHAAAAGKALKKGKWHKVQKGNHIEAGNQGSTGDDAKARGGRKGEKGLGDGRSRLAGCERQRGQGLSDCRGGIGESCPNHTRCGERCSAGSGE